MNVVQERETTIGEYHWIRDPEGRGPNSWSADDPKVPDGDGWRLEGCSMSAGVFAWFWVRDISVHDAPVEKT